MSRDPLPTHACRLPGSRNAAGSPRTSKIQPDAQRCERSRRAKAPLKRAPEEPPRRSLAPVGAPRKNFEIPPNFGADRHVGTGPLPSCSGLVDLHTLRNLSPVPLALEALEHARGLMRKPSARMSFLHSFFMDPRACSRASSRTLARSGSFGASGIAVARGGRQADLGGRRF